MGNRGSSQKDCHRTIHIGQSDCDQFPDNRVVSSKYTLWSFLPKNLYEQFRRFANICFVGITLLSLFTDGPVNPVVYVLPIITIMGATAIKQAYEDYCRHRADQKVNMSTVTVFRRNILVDIPSKYVCVGDIVCLHSEEDVPCDMALLVSSQSDGKCFVTTANLDGETNLKVMECPASLDLTLDDLGNVSGIIVCEDPSHNLYSFSGYIQINDNSKKEERDDRNGHGQINKAFSHENLVLNSLPENNYNSEDEKDALKKDFAPLSAENILLRGSRLKNTNYVYGCVVYTGQETKLALNSRLSKNKFSTVERTINWFLLFFFCLLILEACLSTTCEWINMNNTSKNFLHYLPCPESRFNKFMYLGSVEELKNLKVAKNLFNYIVLYYYIIPTSMYITIEVQRFLGTIFFESDLEMFQKERHAICNTSDLNEELGQVRYVFTDKTGTLTENEMEFQRCSVNGKMYYEEEGKLYLLPSNNGYSVSAVEVPLSAWGPELDKFFLSLAVCHTVQCDNNMTSKIQYQASSTDEKAFVEASARCGVVFSGTLNDRVKVSFKGELKFFKKLELLEFTSERKRMSVILLDEEDNTIWIFCKGAESSVIPLLQNFSDEDKAHLQDFSSRGLRTLVFGCRQLTQSELNEGKHKLLKARSTLDHDAKEMLINSAFLTLEKDLQILGITAVEDRLQDNVPETLASLYAAGIKVWVLTGDKVDTAKSIAYSCGHFKNGTELIHLTEITSPGACVQALNEIKQKVSLERYKQYGLVLDGSTLRIILDHDSQPLIEIAMACSAVVCCRLSPKQKSQIVSLVKCSPKKPITLAIGDGANDVSMIQEAHIGIGIMGKEGQQAVHCSDFAFAQFDCLSRALLVHGRWYYLRAANLILYFFYKNIVFITPQVYYAFGLSPQVLYCALYLLLYNTLFTAVPVVLYGLIEQDYRAKTLIKFPELYKDNKNNKLMSWCNFLLWIIIGFWHSLVIYFVPYYMMKDSDIDLVTFGTAVLHLAIFVVNLKLLLHSQYWTFVFVLSIILSIVGFIGFTLLYSMFFGFFHLQQVDMEVMFHIYKHMYCSFWFWELLILCIVLSLFPDIICRVIKQSRIKCKMFNPCCLGSHKSFNVDTSYSENRTTDGC